MSKVPVPFAFSAAGHSMPAGLYTISRLTENSSVLLIQEEGSGVRTLLLARPATTELKDKPTASLVFSTMASTHVLSGVETPGRMFELSAVSSGATAIRQADEAGKVVAALQLK